jgi:ribulose-phosphate 3-epimerase
MAVSINPSILSSDFANFGSQVNAISNACDYLHVDVMDYHFVPNLTFGLPIVERLLEVCPTPIDAHLMIENPERWAPQYAEVGCKSVTFHYEAAKDPGQVIAGIRTAGGLVGMGIKPGTKLEVVEDLLPQLDMLLVMTVEPGFSGQSFMADMLGKVKRAREIIGRDDLKLAIQVDGGVGAKTIEQCADAGADVFVAGHAVFRTEDPAQACADLRALAANAHSKSWWCGG